MILGLSLLTFIHVAISVIGVGTGLIAVFSLATGKIAGGWNDLFLWFTVATTVTGFMLFAGFTPAFAFGVISSVVLALALYALYGGRLIGRWRWIYVISSMVAFYLNAFVLIVQSFQKVPALHVFAPTGSEPPFAAAQAALFVAFLILTFMALRRFHPRIGRSYSALA